MEAETLKKSIRALILEAAPERENEMAKLCGFGPEFHVEVRRRCALEFCPLWRYQ